MKIRYAVWKGDQCIGVGTAKELAEKFGVKPKTVRFWASPAAKRRDKGKRKVAERI